MKKIEETLDPWQQAVMETHGNITIRAGRQCGKSTVVSKKAHDFARDNAGTVTLIIAASQRQAGFLFDKIKARFQQDDDPVIEKLVKDFQEKNKRFPSQAELRELQMEGSGYIEVPTMTRLIRKNESRIYCLPAGKTGIFIKGLTIDLLIADEAAYIPEVVWNAVLPMVAVSKTIRGFGWIILLSTPFGKGGYFYNTFNDIDFKQFHVSAEKCPRISKEFLLKERQRMSKVEYAQEYLAEFIDDFNQFFPTTLIKKCMAFIEWEFEKEFDPVKYRYFLGVDVARYGGDENAFVVAELHQDNTIKIVRVMTTMRVSLTDTIGRILKYDELYHFSKIFVDDQGLGGGPTDVLIEKLGRRVQGLNNSKRSIDREGTKKTLLKEDMYSNTLVLMESNKLELINDMSLLKSMKSIVFEYSSEGRIKLFGDYSHITEALVRACWCIKEKGLRCYIA